MPGDEGAFDLREDGLLEAVQTGPRIVAGGELGEQVVAQFAAQRLLLMPACAQLAERGDIRGPSHTSQPNPGTFGLPASLLPEPRKSN
ncbi:hypothetical protein GCM10009811_35030 [Nostocoides veronense]|uniref:Uncharacterized protein n=1 Tax=Nostocoides veronense TaxID=330836 RepID=A0ABP4YAC5_9MICO